ncbi:hypothetical protein SASPL_118163 [Salvia splendens]|uniref:Tf2-1-like SH3-like domain-containing protein n=1 Tax=Salvia splendens TaxID=180675 RepID=A0A8X8Y1V7_SALSN|nr:hypothetical protein SASPL_118163 [Salvia splendens]
MRAGFASLTPGTKVPPEGEASSENRESNSVSTENNSASPMPTFDGTDALAWLARAEQYFLISDTAPEKRVGVAMVALAGAALPWYQLLRKRVPDLSWARFARELMKPWPEWSTVQSDLAVDPALLDIKTALEAGRPAARHYELVHDTLFYKWRIVVPPHSPWIPRLLAEFHAQAVVDTLRSRDEVLELLRHHLRRAQDRMTASANRKRRDVEFAVGDMVYVRFRPHRQSTLFSSRNRKLAPRFFGPFRIESRIGATAYRLQLLFHVSLLKRAVGEATAEANLPDGLGGNDPPFLPKKVLHTRSDQRDGEVHSQVLIKLQGMDDDESTWMDTRRVEENKEAIEGNGKRLVC